MLHHWVLHLYKHEQMYMTTHPHDKKQTRESLEGVDVLFVYPKQLMALSFFE